MKPLALCAVFLLLAGAGPIDDGAQRSAGFIEAKALIDAGAYELAFERLTVLAKTEGGDADVQNLLGFAARKSGDLDTAEIAYERALRLDPNHLEALEYQGEMFLALDRPEAALANEARLKTLCPAGCEPLEELTAAIAAWKVGDGS